MNVTAIWAQDQHGVIGSRWRPGLPWKIPDELEHFRQATDDGIVIMGHETWRQLPRKPLPNRANIVLTRRTATQIWGAMVAHTPEQALEAARALAESRPGPTKPSIFVIGGRETFDAMMPHTTRALVTVIDAKPPTPHPIFAPTLGDDWRMVHEGAWQLGDPRWRVQTWEKNK